jgi:C4-type Zn-finger protein
MKAVLKNLPQPRVVTHINFVTYHCPLCNAQLQTVDDVYEDNKGELDHIGYECYECGYEWIES